MKVVIAGELPFLQEVGDLCLDAGHDVVFYLVEDLLSAMESGMMMDQAQDAEVAIELHNESAEAKQELLFALGLALPDDALVLSATLATSATQAAAWMPFPSRVVGFGLLPPIGESGMVELARALQTSDEALNEARSFWHSVGYETVLVGDGPGLVRARIVCCLINEAVGTLMEGVASAEDIDEAMRLGTNYPYGPLQWADRIGLDTVLGVMSGLFREWGDDRYRPSPLLRRMVAAGHLGQKTGRGFYDYADAVDAESGERD
ncbi:MAG: 3-hydroxyacyl-CoA dehydrogenase family protein [Chloroflexota bacterium]